MSAPARVPSKPSLKWGKRPTMDAIATQILADMKPGVIENSSKHKAFNLELQGKRVLVESPVITIPYGASSEMKNEDGTVTQTSKVTCKVEFNTNVPEQAAFVEFLEAFDVRAKQLILENYGKMTRSKDENASEEDKKSTIKHNFKYGTVKRGEDSNGNERLPAAKMTILARNPKDGSVKDLKDTSIWLVDVFQFNEEGEMVPAPASVLTTRGLTAKVTFEMRVTNSQMGYTTSLTARNVVILDQAAGNEEALKAVWAEDEDVQEFKRRKIAAKGNTPLAPAPVKYEEEAEDGDDAY